MFTSAIDFWGGAILGAVAMYFSKAWIDKVIAMLKKEEEPKAK